MVDFAVSQEKIDAAHPAPPELSDPNVVEYDFGAADRRAAAGPVPAGRWDVIVQDLVPKISAKGNAYQQIVFEVIDGAYTPDAAYIGSRIWCNKPWMLGELLIATGYAQPGSTAKVRAGRAELIDFPVVIDLIDREYNGKAQNEVTAIYAADAVPSPPTALPSVLQGAVQERELEF